MISVSLCASAAVTAAPVSRSHSTGNVRAHHGTLRARGAAPQAGLRGRAGPRPGLSALRGLSPAAKPRSAGNRHLLRKMCRFPRGRRAEPRGSSPVSRCPARTCARSRGRAPAAGRHRRARLRGRAAGESGVRVCANADANFVLVMHGVPGTCTAAFVRASLTNSSPSGLQRQNAHRFFQRQVTWNTRPFPEGISFPVLPAGSGLCSGALARRRPRRGSCGPGRAAELLRSLRPGPARGPARCSLPLKVAARAARALDSGKLTQPECFTSVSRKAVNKSVDAPCISPGTAVSSRLKEGR